MIGGHLDQKISASNYHSSCDRFKLPTFIELYQFRPGNVCITYTLHAPMTNMSRNCGHP